MQYFPSIRKLFNAVFPMTQMLLFKSSEMFNAIFPVHEKII